MTQANRIDSSNRSSRRGAPGRAGKLLRATLAVGAMALSAIGSANAAVLSPADNLVYYWDFNGGSSAYSSPHGTGTGAVTNEGDITFASAGFTGQAGDLAMNSGATGDFYSTAVTGLDFSSFSLSMHINTTQAANWRDYISFGTGNGSQFYLEADPAGGANGSGLSLFWNGTPGGVAPGAGSVQGIASNLNNGSWHQIGLTSDGANLRLYIDGTLKGTATYTGTGAITQLQVASRLGDPGRHMNNTSFDDISFWNATLSDAQMAQLSTTPATAVPEPSSVALLASFGTGVLLLVRRRRRRA